jgi:hypothetical protein
MRVGVGGGGLERRARGAGEAPAPHLDGVEAHGGGRVFQGLPDERLAAGQGVGGERQRAQPADFGIAISERTLDDRRRGLGSGHQSRHGQSPDPRRAGIGGRPLGRRRPAQQVPRAGRERPRRTADAGQRLEAAHRPVDGGRVRLIHASGRRQLRRQHRLGYRHLLGRGVAQPSEGGGQLAPDFPQAQLGILRRAFEEQRLHLRHGLGRRGRLRQRPGRFGTNAGAVAEGRRDEPDIAGLSDAAERADARTPLGPLRHRLAHRGAVARIFSGNDLFERGLLRRRRDRRGLALRVAHPAHEGRHRQPEGQRAAVTSHTCAPEYSSICPMKSHE